QDRNADAGQGRGRRAVERRSVQRLFATRARLDRRRRNVRREQSQEAAGERLRARPAGRGRRQMIGRIAALLLLAVAAPVGAQTFAIVGGTVGLGNGSEPIPNGMVIVRDGRIVAAGDVRMKLPAGTQVIDATGKWVTPGIVAGFSRLGLA